MDGLLCRAYDSGARMGRIGNSLAHLMLGLSSLLKSVPLDQSTRGFALMTRELGLTLSTLVHARRQLCLVQSPLTEPCRRALRALPVVPGVSSGGTLRFRRAGGLGAYSPGLKNTAAAGGSP
ncbi:hypothetical protein ILYODFUR_038610 [Ilyodon furcidens]|uniref:Uncharacterized protein n=1 Tax=Ilyodon furcidens TaxID=33524 RepID=A0ABV0TIM3_9TELE